MSFAVDWTKDVWQFIVRLLISIICGVIIGIERKTRSKEAGIRTHAIVCMASALFMILSKYMVGALGPDTLDGDPTRIAASVVSGIGFLGAGIIMYRHDIMRGLTTAAGVWATSAIGMAIGAGFIVTGICATLFLLILQIIFHLPIKAFVTKHLTVLKIQIWLEDDEIIDNITKELGSGKITAYKVKNTEDKVIASLEFTSSTHFTVNQMNNLMHKFPSHVLSVECNDE